MWAAKRQQLKIAAILLEYGADIDAVDNSGTLLFAVFKDGVVTINLSGSTALHHACVAQRKHMVRFLLCNGCSIEITDNDGKTAFQLANEDTMVEFMKIVLTMRKATASNTNIKSVIFY
jgi:ankyrin repeat protein